VLTGCDNKESEGDGVEEVAGHDLLGGFAEDGTLLKVFLIKGYVAPHTPYAVYIKLRCMDRGRL